METIVYDDVTTLVNDVVRDLKPGQMVHSNLFNLYDSMSAIEIYDPKMDLKSNLKDCVTLESALKKEIIKKPENLTVQELTGLFDDLLGKEYIWLSGQSLPHTIYTFSYLYNSDLYESHKFLKPYIDALHFGGNLCQDLIRHSLYLREEDYIPSSIGFVSTKGEDELIQALINAEYELEDNLSQKKKKKKKNENEKATYNEYDALHARLKLRRGLLNLYSSLKVKYSLKAKEQVANHINFCRKTIEVIKETLEHSADVEKYFIDSINKTLLCHIPPRKIKTISKKDAIVELEKFLDNIQYVLNIGTYTNFFEIYKTLENLSITPRNVLSRAYLDVNVFVGGQYFGLTPMKQLALDALEEFNIIKGRDLVTMPEVIKFMENSVNLLEEIFASNLRCRTKQRRELVKLYQHINIFAHDAYTLDQNVLGKGEDKPHVIFLWVLDIALKLMVKQLFMGFELELYNEAEYCIVFYLLDHVFSFLDRNYRGVIAKYEKEFLIAYQTKEMTDKKKKKLTPFQKKFFYEHLFYRAVEAYSRCMMKITYMIIYKDIIAFNKDPSFLKNRYYKRLKIFDFIYFLKKPEFSEFTEDMKKLEEKDVNKLDAHYTDVKAELDNAIKLLNEVTSEEGIDEKIKQDAEKLKKICVLNSLQMMKLKMNKDKLGEFKAIYKHEEHKFYPVLDLQKK